MKTWKIAVSVSYCWILASGCSICQHPSYDCGPVYSQGTCQNCNADYRAGSILNRRGAGSRVEEDVSNAGRPIARAGDARSRAAQTAQGRTERSDGSESRVRATTVAQERRTPKRAAVEREAAQTPSENTVAAEAASPKHLPPGTVAAPPGTKEGDTRVLSVTDRRLDESQQDSQPDPKPLVAAHKAPQRMVDKPSEDLGGWRPVTRHQDPAETPSWLRDIDR